MFQRLMCLFLLTLSFTTAHARVMTREEYFAFRATIEMAEEDAAASDSNAVEDYTLPTSQGYDQGKSALCWAYATLNVIESDYLHGHPGSKISLSRAAVQRLNMDNQYRSWFASGYDAGCWECGNAEGAIQIFLKQGIYDWADYRPLPAATAWTKPFPIESKDLKDRVAELGKKLDATFGALPAKTHSADHAREIAPLDLTKEVIGEGAWIVESVKDRMPESIRASLKAGHALVVFWHGHLEEIYGATYDDKGALTQLRIKGSYGPNFLYTVKPEALQQVNWLSRATRFL